MIDNMASDFFSIVSQKVMAYEHFSTCDYIFSASPNFIVISSINYLVLWLFLIITMIINLAELILFVDFQ